MNIVLIPAYILWHYTRGIRDLFLVLRNIGKAVLRIFSLKLLLSTLLDPFERLGESYERGKIEQWFEAFTVNTLMRIVGFLVRSSLILVGFFVLILWMMFSVLMIIVWIILPLIIAGLLYVGIFNIIHII
jgi:hypothetical protein